MTDRPYFLGCPVWACDDWVGSFYSSRDRRKWLAAYSRVFNSVEGNSTFYGIPSPDTVTRWATETRDGFRFVLKFPGVITHERRLRDCQVETRQFLRLLEILAKANRLGPSLLQLPPTFSGKQLPLLAKYLQRLPREFPIAVEVRHFDYYDGDAAERQLTDLLTGFAVDWVLFDSRALYSQPPSDESEYESQRRKPRTPYRTTVTAAHPVVRFIGRNCIPESEPWIDSWAETLVKWIHDGLTPYVFMHTPHDRHAPEFARSLHNRIVQLCPSVPKLPLPAPTTNDRQLRLF